MNNNNFIFTKSRMGLDSGVWLTMLTTLVLALIILSFKAATYEQCSLDEIKTAGLRQQGSNIFYVGETVSFYIANPAGKSLQWDFDDGTPLQKGEKTVQHRFFKKGNFNVTCSMLGSSCEQTVLVNIIQAPPKLKDTLIFYGKPIDGPDTVYIGIAANYSTQIKGSYFQWNASGLPDIKTSPQASFVFYKEGPQILNLKVDGSKNYTKPIIVLSKKSIGGSGGGAGGGLPASSISLIPYINSISPVSGGPGTKVTINGSFFNGTKSVSFGGIEAASFEITSSTELKAVVAEGSQTGPVIVTTGNGPTPAPTPQFTFISPKAPVVTAPVSPAASAPVHKGISDPSLLTLLKKVANGDPNATTQKVAEFFCNGEGTLVKMPSEKKAITLGELCKRLQAAKDVTVESAKVVRDPNNPDCEINLLVSYSEPKKVFGIKVGKKKN